MGACENAEPELFELKVDGEKFAGEFLFVEVLNLASQARLFR